MGKEGRDTFDHAVKSTEEAESHEAVPIEDTSDPVEQEEHGRDADGHETKEDGIRDIESLQWTSIQALRNLALHRAPPDNYPMTKRAAVLCLLFGSRKGALNVLLSTRSPALRSHPGEVCLPGGKAEADDADAIATARREAWEEIGIPQNDLQVRHLTTLPPHLTRNGLLVTPVVCFCLDYSLQPILSADEVADVFSHPLEGFLYDRPPARFAPSTPEDEDRGDYHQMRDFNWLLGAPHRFHSFASRRYPVTGFTSRILIDVAEIAYGRKPEFQKDADGQKADSELIAESFRVKGANGQEVWSGSASKPRL